MPFTWDLKSARYRGEGGRFVARSTVRLALDEALDSAEKTVSRLASSLRAGSISLVDWQAGMMREIKSAHLASSALAKGGWAQMGPADFGRVGAVLKTQYAYLARFASQIESGEQDRGGSLANRAGLYIQAARPTYHAVEREGMQARGVREERSRLGAADHCAGCVAEDARGWVPLGFLVPVGSRECGVQCRCVMDYRGSAL